jgi:hypothetical protein
VGTLAHAARKNHCFVERKSGRIRPREVMGDHRRQTQQGRMELGWVRAIDSEGRTIWIADAHRGDGKRFIVHADEKLRGFLKLESVTRACGKLSCRAGEIFSTLGVVWKPGSGQEAFLPELSSSFSDLNCEGSTRRGQTKQRKINMKLQNLIHILINRRGELNMHRRSRSR